jgi:hypothetical protein
MLNDDKKTETNLSLWKFFTDDEAIVGIRIFRMDQNSQNERIIRIKKNKTKKEIKVMHEDIQRILNQTKGIK